MRLGLALSGGGALGAAHIGVLEELEAVTPIDIICGSSAGAILGLLYADGGLEAVHCFSDTVKCSPYACSTAGLLSRSPSVIFSGVRRLLTDTVRARSFADLSKDFCCVATDILSGELVILDEGDPIEAVMASSCFPGVLRPLKIGGRMLVDGGVTRNLPADVVRSRGADFVVGSSLFGRFTSSAVVPGKREPGRLESALRALDLMAREMAEYQSRSCDFCFFPPVDTLKWYDFDRLEEIITIGRRYARAEITSLTEVMRSAGCYSR